MTTVSVTYERQLGPVPALEPGQWTDETVTGRPAICCARCSGIYDIPETHRIEADGFVVPALRCEHAPCGEFGYIRLLNYADEVAR